MLLLASGPFVELKSCQILHTPSSPWPCGRNDPRPFGMTWPVAGLCADRTDLGSIASCDHATSGGPVTSATFLGLLSHASRRGVGIVRGSVCEGATLPCLVVVASPLWTSSPPCYACLEASTVWLGIGARVRGTMLCPRARRGSIWWTRTGNFSLMHNVESSVCEGRKHTRSERVGAGAKRENSANANASVARV